VSKSTTKKILWVLAILLIFAAGAAYSFLDRALAEYESIVEEYESRPQMPIELSYRSAMMGPGLVIELNNTSTRYLTVIVTLINPTLNKKENYRIDLSPNSTKEIGHAEGWAFASGDTIEIVHNEYKTLAQKLP